MSNENNQEHPEQAQTPRVEGSAATGEHGTRYSLLERLLLFLSKTDLHVLQFCTPETRMTQVSLGMMVLITGILAFTSSYFAVHSSFFGKSVSIIGLGIPALISMFYATAIMFFDREIVAATTKAAAIPRLILAILIGIVIAFPIKMKLLEGRIDAEIITMVEERNAGKLAEIEDLTRTAETARKTERERRILPYARQVESMESHVREQEQIRRQRLNSYNFGIDKLGELVVLAQDEYDRERNRVTCGPICQKRLTELKEVRAEFDAAKQSLKEVTKSLDIDVAEARGQLKQAYKSLDAATKRVEQGLDELFSGDLQRIAALRGEVDTEKRNSYDFLSQFLALERITERDPAARVLSIFLILFFIILEVFPVVIKLFIPYSEYNAYLDSRRRLNQNRLVTIANFTLDEIKKHPERAHINKQEITDIFERVLEDRSIDVEMERNMRDRD